MGHSSVCVTHCWGQFKANMHTWVNNRKSVVCHRSCGGGVSSSSLDARTALLLPQQTTTRVQQQQQSPQPSGATQTENGNSYCAAVSRCSSSPNQASPLSPARSSSAATSAATRALPAAKPCSSCCATAGCPARAAAHAALYLTSARSEASPSKWGRCSAESAGRQTPTQHRQAHADAQDTFIHSPSSSLDRVLTAAHTSQPLHTSAAQQQGDNVPAKAMPACVYHSVNHPQSCRLLTVVPKSSGNV